MGGYFQRLRCKHSISRISEPIEYESVVGSGKVRALARGDGGVAEVVLQRRVLVLSRVTIGLLTTTVHTKCEDGGGGYLWRQ